jgi:arylformamidase
MNLMSIIDISRELYDGMPSYPGDPPFSCKPLSVLDENDPESCATTSLSLTSHSGTHLDAPAHFIPGGETIDRVPLEILCGPALVVDLSDRAASISKEALAACGLDKVERLIIKTAGDDAHLTLDGARYLRQNTSVRLIGIDRLSIEALPSPGHPVHKTLLGGNEPIYIIEGLDLKTAQAGDYQLVCLPLKIRGMDGAPARVLLVVP